MEDSNSYRFPELKGNENYESWGVDATRALKAKGLWWFNSGKLEKPEIPDPNVTAAAKKEYASAINHWEDKNDRACGMINFSIEQRPRIHSDLTTLHLAIGSSPNQSNQTVTLYEAWHGKKPDLSYLHTLGCTAYHHMEDHMEGARRKLDDKSLKCQFLGYERAGWLLNRPAPQEGAG